MQGSAASDSTVRFSFGGEHDTRLLVLVSLRLGSAWAHGSSHVYIEV